MRAMPWICKAMEENYMYEHNVKDTSGNYCEHNIKWSLDIKIENSRSSGARTNKKKTCCCNQWKTMWNKENGVDKNNAQFEWTKK